jgi:hypothetical protein
MRRCHQLPTKVLVLLLALSIATIGFFVPLPSTSVAAQATPDPGLDQYGGWKGIQGHNTTGHWTVELIGDRYWFVTPENNVLWDLTCLHMDPGSEQQYSAILQYAPTYLGNIAKYGVDASAWATAVGKDMASLGFNVGESDMLNSVSIPGMNIMEHLDHSYTEAWNAGEMNVPLLKGESIRKFPDVFDEKFRLLWQRTCQDYLTPVKNNLHLIAVNLGGELEWFGGTRPTHGVMPPDMFISAPRTYAGKQYWVNVFLHGRYVSIQALNVAYGTTFQSWDGVLDCTILADNTKYPAIRADKLDFTGVIADKYYSVMTSEVKKIVPNTLIFCERWLECLSTPETMPYAERIWAIAGKYCDVMSLQAYGNLPDQERQLHVVSRCAIVSGKPVMITESSSFANDTSVRASDSGAVTCDLTQMDRARRYVDMMKWLYDFAVTGMNGSSTPVHVFIGRHWYKWYNDAVLGAPGYPGTVGEYMNWGIHDNQDERYIPFADVMATVNKQSYAVTTGQHPLIVPDPPTPLTPVANAVVGNRATFTWKAIPNARSYTLLLSAERAFPDAQTIRVDGITGTSYTLPSPLAQGNWWWTVCAVENTYGYSGLYPDATNFRVKNEPGTLAATLDCEQLNRVTFEDIWDAGGVASSYAFLDTAEKTEGSSSVRCVFTRWAENKTGFSGRSDASVFIDCAGATEPWTGVSLAVRPTNFCDTTQKLVPSSKYLRVRVWDSTGTLFLDWPLDPEGKLPIGQWSNVTVPFGVLGPHSVAKIALTFVTEQDKLATDQRLTINVDKIVPVTEAADATAPASPFITSMTVSNTTVDIGLDAADQESGIGSVQVSLGRTPSASDLVPWTTAHEDMTLSLPFVPSATYPWYVNVKAQNGAGTWSAVTTVDGSAWSSSTRVNSMALEHGSVSPAGTVLIPSGSAQSFSVTPDFGYAVHDVTVDGVSQGTRQTVTVPGDGKVHLVIARFAFDKNAWSLDRLPAQVKTTITMPVGSTSYQKNGMAMTLDVPPYIDASSGRTLVPVRAISEGLGAGVQWNAADRTVTLSFEGLTATHVVKMIIGAMAYTIDGKSAWMDVAPVIVGGRTFVPLRAASQALGATVDWDAATRTVVIQGLDIHRMPTEGGMTLKEIYDAASSWDSNGDDISDMLEQSFLSGLPATAPCDRLVERTGVFSRMDDGTPAMVLPMLSLVSPIGVHGAFTKVHYAGRLTGYVRTAALEKGNLVSTVVNDTEKWVVASGPSLQSFLDNAVTTQGSAGFIPGESITVSGNKVIATCAGNRAAWFQTSGTINVPTGVPGGSFGIQFRMTSTITPPVDRLEKILSGSADFESYAIGQTGFCLIGSTGQWVGNWWSDFREIQIAADQRGVSNAATNDYKVVSTFPLLRSGQLYDIRFSDGTGRKAVITLPDGTIVDDIDMTAFPWNDKGGCFPNHTLVLGMWIAWRSSTTISDLAFVVPPTMP